ncbi:hypothetical protein WJX82_005554 [Trebouxia sp. C0006]
MTHPGPLRRRCIRQEAQKLGSTVTDLGRAISCWSLSQSRNSHQGGVADKRSRVGASGKLGSAIAGEPVGCTPSTYSRILSLQPGLLLEGLAVTPTIIQRHVGSLAVVWPFHQAFAVTVNGNRDKAIQVYASATTSPPWLLLSRWGTTAEKQQAGDRILETMLLQ